MRTVRFKKDDVLRMTVFEDIKIVPLQAGDRVIFSIGDHHVDEHLAHRGFDGRLAAGIFRLRCSWLLCGGAGGGSEGRAPQGENNQASKLDQESGRTAQLSVAILSLSVTSHREILLPAM